MPRIYSSCNDPIDVCADCWDEYTWDETVAFAKFGHDGDGPDDRGNCFSYNAEHPDYTGDDEQYRCEFCKKFLTEQDNVVV